MSWRIANRTSIYTNRTLLWATQHLLWSSAWHSLSKAGPLLITTKVCTFVRYVYGSVAGNHNRIVPPLKKHRVDHRKNILLEGENTIPKHPAATVNCTNSEYILVNFRSSLEYNLLNNQLQFSCYLPFNKPFFARGKLLFYGTLHYIIIFFISLIQLCSWVLVSES